MRTITTSRSSSVRPFARPAPGPSKMESFRSMFFIALDPPSASNGCIGERRFHARSRSGNSRAGQGSLNIDTSISRMSRSAMAFSRMKSGVDRVLSSVAGTGEQIDVGDLVVRVPLRRRHDDLGPGPEVLPDDGRLDPRLLAALGEELLVGHS